VKGPGLRIDLDVRRVWRCPKCGRTVRTPAHVVSQRCGCSEQGQWMRLEPPVKREPFRAPPREPIPDDDEVAEIELPKTTAAAEAGPAPAVAGQQVVEPLPADQQPIAAQTVQPLLESAGADKKLEIAPPPEAAPATPADDFGAGVEENSSGAPK